MRIDQIELTGSLSISSSLAASPLRVNKTYLFVSNTGNVGIGTNNPTSKLAVTGSASIRGGIKATTASGSFTFNESICSLDTKTAFKLPVGTTTERPATPTTGFMRYNTTTSALEIHLSGRWQKVSVSDYPVIVEYLVVAGGGSGGSTRAGGGGAGGYRTNVIGQTSGGGNSAEGLLYLNLNTPYPVLVGSGGPSTLSGGNGSKGVNSYLNNIISIGGGAGGSSISPSYNGGTGGSGGGGGAADGTNGTGANPEVANQGYKGGNGLSDNSSWTGAGGGGGGAAGAGNNAPAENIAGSGGIALSSNITGSSILRAAGGGGGVNVANAGATAALGGSGIGGNGSTSAAATSGNQWTGSGGGGSGGNTGTSYASGQGGSGVVIVKYPNTYADLTLSVGIQYATPESNGASSTNITTSGIYAPSYTITGFKVYEFRGTGGVPLNISWQD